MKNTTIIFVFVLMFFTSNMYGQQIVSTKGDKVAVTDIQLEPWRVEFSADTKATSNTQNIYQNANVGIGDFSSKPTTKQLEVEGNIKSEKAFVTGMDISANNPANRYANVGVNTTTGELVKFSIGENNRPFSYITYEVTTREGEEWVNNLDTKIPVSDYTVFLINAILDPSAILDLSDPNKNYMGSFSYSARTNVRNRDASFTPKDTWHLQADYLKTGPLDKSKSYKWKLVCLVIQNAQVFNSGSVSVQLDDKNGGTVTQPINGL